MINKIRLVFTSKNTLSSALIRFFTWSKYSHVEILVNEHESVGATFTQGVSKNEISEILKNTSDHAFYEIDCYVSEEFFLNTINNELGKKYDWVAWFAFIFRNRKWEDKNKWFCSELVAYVLIRCGVKLFNERVSKITPRDLYINPLLKKVN